MNSKTVLVVDDDVLFRRRIVREFNGLGWVADGVATFDEAISCVQETQPDLALIDVYLRPGDPSGLEVVAALNDLAPRTIVAVTSASTCAEVIVEAMKSGASTFIGKPLTAIQIIEAVLRSPAMTSSQVQFWTRKLGCVTWRHINRTIAECSGNKTEAARILGITRRGLQKMLKKPPSPGPTITDAMRISASLRTKFTP